MKTEEVALKESAFARRQRQGDCDPHHKGGREHQLGGSSRSVGWHENPRRI
jgi:hypothetical protein